MKRSVDQKRCRVRIGAVVVALIGSLLLFSPSVAAQQDDSPVLHAGHSGVLRLYEATLGRSPDVAGATFWINAYNSGDWSTRRIADFFASSDEFAATYGNSLSTADFVTVVYQNVLDRDPDQAGFDFWVDAIDDGMTRAEAILLISNAPEFIGQHPFASDAEPDTGPTGQTVSSADVAALLPLATSDPEKSEAGEPDPEEPPTGCYAVVLFGPDLVAPAQVNPSPDCPDGALLTGSISVDDAQAQPFTPAAVLDLTSLEATCVGAAQEISWNIIIELPGEQTVGPFMGATSRTCEFPPDGEL